MTSSRYEAIIIDWAGTITVPLLDVVLHSAGELGFTGDDLTRAFAGLSGYFNDPDSIFHRAEVGLVSDDELRAHLDDIAEGAGQLLDADPPSIFFAEDRPEMIALLEELGETDTLVILATNNFVTGQDILATRYLESGLVQAIVNSALVGVRKPNPAFFALILDTFELDPTSTLVIDDLDANLEVARDLGMGTVLIDTDTVAAVDEIRRLIGPSATSGPSSTSTA